MKQVIIWCNYYKEFEVIQDMLGDKCDCVYSKVSIEDKNKNIKAFKEGKVQYLVVNPASADKALTLTNTRFVIYFSMNDSLELFESNPLIGYTRMFLNRLIGVLTTSYKRRVL